MKSSQDTLDIIKLIKSVFYWDIMFLGIEDLNNLAEECFNKDKYDESHKYLDQAINLQLPMSDFLFFNKSLVFHMQRKNEPAIKGFWELSDIEEYKCDSLYMIGNNYVVNRNMKEGAIPFFERAIALDKSYALAYNGLICCLNNNDLSKVEEVYYTAIYNCKLKPITFMNLALLYSRDNPDKAKLFLTEGLKFRKEVKPFFKDKKDFEDFKLKDFDKIIKQFSIPGRFDLQLPYSYWKS